MLGMRRRLACVRFGVEKMTEGFLERVAVAATMSGLMSLIVSCISTLRALGIESLLVDPGDAALVWLGAWGFSWIVATPTVYFVAPLSRRLVRSVFGRVARHSQGNAR